MVLLTPDDLANCAHLTSTDKPCERTLTGQARPNVLFEAGMAFATHPGQTVMVQVGQIREFGDIGGRHVVHMSNDFPKRKEFATKPTNADCDVDTSRSDWTTAGDFDRPSGARALETTQKEEALIVSASRSRLDRSWNLTHIATTGKTIDVYGGVPYMSSR
jgi:hypothetical protein